MILYFFVKKAYFPEFQQLMHTNVSSYFDTILEELGIHGKSGNDRFSNRVAN